MKRVLRNLGIGGRIIIKQIFKKWDERTLWNGLIWLRIETSDKIL